MKKSELIKKLNEISETDFDVVVADWGKNLNATCGDACGVGMYADFEISLEENANENSKHAFFIALSIDNDDYDENGILRLE